MTTLPIIFPGQGAQARGMGRDFADAFPEAAATWEEADQALAALKGLPEGEAKTSLVDMVGYVLERLY